MSVAEELVARSNRLGADPRTTNYAGGNTSAKGTAVVGTYHGLGNMPRGRSRLDPRNALRRRLYRAAAAATDRTIAVSPAVRDWLCGEMGFDERKTVLLMNGVDTAAFAELSGRDDECTRAQLGLSGRTVVRVFSETRPSPAFEPAEPDLHDVYFNAIAETAR